jgi:hypothetical protein
LFDIHVYLDIGLLQCYSDICKTYSDVEYFLEVKLPQYNQEYFNITSPFSSTADTDGMDFNLPKLPYLVQLEKHSLDTFIDDFKLVSKITIFNISVSIILLLIFFLLFFYDICLFRMIVLFPKLYDTLLLTAVCFYILALMCYVYLTLTKLEDGHYESGVWISIYTCLFGTICCVIANWCPGWHTRARLLNPNDYRTNGFLVDDLTPLLTTIPSPSAPSAPNYHTYRYISYDPMSSVEMLRVERMERGQGKKDRMMVAQDSRFTSSTS